MFSSWMLALIFEGRILYAVADNYNYDLHQMIFASFASHTAGLLFWGFIIKTKRLAKFLILCSIAFCAIVSFIFFFPPSPLWIIAAVLSSFMIAAGIAAWSYFFRS